MDNAIVTRFGSQPTIDIKDPEAEAKRNDDFIFEEEPPRAEEEVADALKS
tara:strand:+ start:894 stop:1043 length:150 start_codon:yes stop_codon:yes gene_type:complete